jgi:hypothetical protein
MTAPGTTYPGTTTLAQLVDAVYANRTAALTAATAVFTVIDPVTLQVSWPTYNDVIFFRFTARPLPPEFITL